MRNSTNCRFDLLFALLQQKGIIIDPIHKRVLARAERLSTPVCGAGRTVLRKSMRKREREKVREDERAHENRLLCKSILRQVSQQAEIFYHHDEV